MFYGIPAEKQLDFQRVIDTLKEIYPDVYGADMLICMWRNMAFRQNKRFMKSFNDASENDVEKSLLWRLHVLSWAAENALEVEGDFVECGVLKGFSSRVLCDYLDFGTRDKHFLLYDTFAGLPETTSTEQERIAWDYSSYDSEQLYKEVKSVFSAYPNVEVLKGIVPDIFSQTVPDKIAFLHIDMNSERAEMLALEALFEKVTPGGFIVLDDFGWACNRNQMQAELQFMNDRKHRILELPTGQGVILKTS